MAHVALRQALLLVLEAEVVELVGEVVQNVVWQQFHYKAVKLTIFVTAIKLLFVFSPKINSHVDGGLELVVELVLAVLML